MCSSNRLTDCAEHTLSLPPSSDREKTKTQGHPSQTKHPQTQTGHTFTGIEGAPTPGRAGIPRPGIGAGTAGGGDLLPPPPGAEYGTGGALVLPGPGPPLFGAGSPDALLLAIALASSPIIPPPPPPIGAGAGRGAE